VNIPAIKITVIKKLSMADVHPHGEGGAAPDSEPVCPMFEVGDEFTVQIGDPPQGFCQAAFDDIYR